MDKRRTLITTVAVAVLVLIVALLAGYCERHSQSTPTAVPSASESTPVSGLPTITRDELPKQALYTLGQIDKGGPFKYKQDGGIFSNAERRLPKQDRGYYREYTVETPGSRDRGARRIVTGRAGDMYYTSDHYDSFRQILR